MTIIEGHICKKNAKGYGAKYQEKLYGKGRRVVNEGKAGWNCTVCGEVLRAGSFTIVG